MANCRNCGAPMLVHGASNALVCRHCGTYEESPALVPNLEIVGASYSGPRQRVIDTCERCRVNWLDAGELRRIARAPHGHAQIAPSREADD